MRERIEDSKSIPRRKSCDQPYSLAVCSAIYFSRPGAWVDYNGGDIYSNSFLGARRPNMAVTLVVRWIPSLCKRQWTDSRISSIVSITLCWEHACMASLCHPV